MKSFYCLLLITSISSCNFSDQKPVDNAKLQEELKDREIKRLSEAQIIEAAQLKGNQLVESAKKFINDNASSSDLIDNQALTASDISERISAKFSENPHTIKIYFSEDSLVISAGVEKQLLDAYAYNQENGFPLEENIQTLGDSIFLYTSPIFIKDIKLLKSDEDQVHDKMIGMWAVSISRKELIRNL